MIRSLQGRSWLMALGVVASWSGTAAFGQGNTFNPYGNSGYADYREFTTPMYSNDPSLPGQARLQSLYGNQGRPNQFESYLNSVETNPGDQSGTGRTSASGVPYYRANQIYDKDNKRSYRPNDTAADRQFRERIAQRNAAYAQAQEEKDPRVRAQKLQRIERDALVSPVATPKSLKTATPRAAANAATRLPAATSAATPAPRPTAAPARPTQVPAVAPPASTPAAAPVIPIPAPPR